MTLRELCRQKTALAESDIAELERIATTIGYMADLTGSDIFIDCLCRGGGGCLVVAEAKPTDGLSVYDCQVIGQGVSREKEPAVFAAMETAMPVRDIRAITQENRLVRQDVVPVKNESGAVIGVLIREKDISERAYRDRKYEELAREKEEQSELLERFGGGVTPYTPSVEQNRTAMKEVHHRVKNNLQMVASILNIQARHAELPEVKAAFKENVSRVLSFAAIHDLLTQDETLADLSVREVAEKVCFNIFHSTGCPQKGIAIQVLGDDIQVDADRATSIAIVVNELVMNAVEHAFADQNGGEVQVILSRGNSYSAVTVADNGGGFSLSGGSSFGLDLVNATVRDKLRGKLHVASGEEGSRISFDFLHEIG